MTMINLREYYPDSYTTDCFIAVPDEIAETLRRFKLEDEAYRMTTARGGDEFPTVRAIYHNLQNQLWQAGCHDLCGI